MGKAGFGGQRSLLETQNILRPRALFSNDLRPSRDQINEFAFESENGKNCKGATLDGGAYTNPGQAYTIGGDQTRAGLGGHGWTQNQGFSTSGEVSAGAYNPAQILSQEWMQDKEMNEVTAAGGKAVNTAEQVLEPARPENGLALMRGAHLDGPVFPVAVTEEADAGQMADWYNASSEFECDGNSFTSLTHNSME